MTSDVTRGYPPLANRSRATIRPGIFSAVTTTPFARPALPSVLAVEASLVVVPAPGEGDGYWAGGPSAILDDGTYYLAYRLRRPVGEGRGYANVLARSDDGVHFEPVVSLTSEDYGCDSLERPALVRRPDGGWRVYLSLATRGTKHWSVIALDADDLAGLGDPTTSTRHSVWSGDLATVAVKDPVVMYDAGSRQWHAWVCCHPLTEPDQTDRMTTRHAVSADGLDWQWTGDALVPQPGRWDSRGTRLTAVVAGPDGLGTAGDLAFYDGRASAAENWYERTGLAVRNGSGTFSLVGSEPYAQSPYGEHTLRYASAVALPDGGLRVYFEAAAETDGNDLRTQLLDLDPLRALAVGAAPDAG
jgi:hypothetical protein